MRVVWKQIPYDLFLRDSMKVRPCPACRIRRVFNYSLPYGMAAFPSEIRPTPSIPYGCKAFQLDTRLIVFGGGFRTEACMKADPLRSLPPRQHEGPSLPCMPNLISADICLPAATWICRFSTINSANDSNSIRMGSVSLSIPAAFFLRWVRD